MNQCSVPAIELRNDEPICKARPVEPVDEPAMAAVACTHDAQIRRGSESRQIAGRNHRIVLREEHARRKAQRREPRPCDRIAVKVIPEALEIRELADESIGHRTQIPGAQDLFEVGQVRPRAPLAAQRTRPALYEVAAVDDPTAFERASTWWPHS